MTSEPPSDASQEQEERPEPESTDPDAGREPRADGGKALWMSVAVIAGLLAVAWGVAVFLLSSSQPDTLAQQRPQRAGLACPFLRQAADAHDRGERAAFDRTIAKAAKVAEDTLEKSSQVFGEPERIALELTLGTQPHIAELLTQAEKVCSPLGQWKAAST